MGSSSSDSVTSSRQRRLTRTYLPDDFWYEIFLHLPIGSIYKFRCVSKLWLSILSNPNFINHWYKLHTASLWALLHYGHYFMYFKAMLSYPELNSQFISHHQSGFSFRFLNQEYDLSNTTSFLAGLFIIGSSNGLVLCTTSYPIHTTYYVCNPLTKRWVLLPPPPPPQTILITGFECEETCSSSLISTTYKVIRVPILMFEGASTFKVDIFSSDSGEWNVYDVICPPGAKLSFSFFDNLVTHNGVFYWMQKQTNTVLTFSMNKNNNRTCGSECRLINLPDRAIDDEHKLILGESEGLICYAVVKYTERSLSVWVLKDDWYLLHKDTKFHDFLAKMESLLIGVESRMDLFSDIEVLGFNPFDKNVVILGYKKCVWAYNIRTKGYEQLSQASFLGNNLSGSHVGLFTFVLKLRPTILPPVSS